MHLILLWAIQSGERNQVMKKIIFLIIAVLLLVLAFCWLKQPEHPVGQEWVENEAKASVLTSNIIKVVSLNLAHGRKESLNQLLLSGDRIRNNLNDIAALLQQSRADIVGLQEADAASLWSGYFNHVAWLAEVADYPVYAQSGQAVSCLFSYGTALLSHSSFAGVLHHTFEPSPPTMNKGFTMGQIAWNPQNSLQNPLQLDIVSVHLDFSRQNIREQQVAEIIRTFSERDYPLIVLGDFNSDWSADDKVLRELAEQTGLQVYQPEATDLGTYNSNGRRLDWILISNDLEFKSYKVLPDMVSDHLAVMAEIGLKDFPLLTNGN